MPQPTPHAASVSTSTAGGTTTLSMSFTAVAGVPLIVETGYGSGGTNEPTGVTFNGTALTKLKGQGDGGWNVCDVWYMLNPPAVTANIVMTTPGTGPLSMGAQQWDNVDVSNGSTSAFGTPVGNFTRSDANPTTGSISSDANSVVVGAMCSDCEAGQTPDGTVLWDIDNINNDDSDGAQYKTTAPATLNWTGGNGAQTGWAAIGFSLHGTAVVRTQQGRMAVQQRMM